MAAGKTITLRIPPGLKSALAKAKKRQKMSMAKIVAAALEQWMLTHSQSATSGTEPFDDFKADEDGHDNVQAKIPVSLKLKLESAAEKRRDLTPKVWPNSENGIGVQALKDWLQKHGFG